MKRWALFVPLMLLNMLLILWSGFAGETQSVRDVVSCVQLFLTVIA